MGLIRFGIDYIRKPLFTVAYFLFVSFSMLIVFRYRIYPFVENFAVTPFIFLVLLFIFNFFVYFFARRFLKKPEEFIAKSPNEFSARMDYNYLISKPFDILTQQIFMVIFLSILVSLGFNLAEIILISVLIFALMHVPLLASVGRFWGIFYTVAGIFSALIFPILILKVHYGFVYSYIIHWLFYTLSALFFWIRYGGLKHEESSNQFSKI